MDNTLQALRRVTRNLPRSLELKASDKRIAREVDYYLKNIGSVKSIDAFLKNTRLFNFAMTAFGLEDMTHAKGLMRKVLTEGVSQASNLASKLDDDRYKAFATAFDFAASGEDATSAQSVGQPVAERYVRQMLEDDEGQENEAVSLALYFQRAAPTVSSAYGLLADSALWTVVQTIFDFPDAMANAAIEKQAKAVTDRLNLADLKNPTKMEALLTRFAVKWDVANNTGTAPVLALFTTASSVSTGSDASFSILSLKYGG